MVAFRFREYDRSLFRHNHDVGVVIEKSVDTKPPPRNVAVPPADIGKSRQFHNKFPLQAVHFLLGGVKRFPNGGHAVQRMNFQRHGVAFPADNPSGFQPVAKLFRVVLFQQAFDFLPYLPRIGHRGLFQSRELVGVHIAQNNSQVALQFPGVHEIHPVKLMENHLSAFLHALFRGKPGEVFLEIPLVGVRHFERFWDAPGLVLNVHHRHFRVRVGKVNFRGLPFQGKALRKRFLSQQRIVPVGKETVGDG